MSKSLTAVDLFCGGGGLSEGFRQAGVEITHAVDIDEGACETHRLNHPETEVIEADVCDIEPEDLPSDIDLLIGSPPCSEFSWAKQGGGGDIDEGMRLVKRFLYFVAELDPDYWVMENVPRLDNYLPEHVEYADIPWLDREGSLDLEKHILDGDDYGTPQRRSRLFSGQFPCPEPSDEPVFSFGEIREHFPRPTDSPAPESTITDPNYDIELQENELTDHFYNSHVTNREAEEIRRRKEDHSFYGKMSFPDDPDVPSRTVLATNRRVARETLVMEEETAPDGLSRFRKPTIREIATIQGFPITYQFTGTSQAQKWRRVGDAVPPTMAFHLAQAIQRDAGVDVAEQPEVSQECPPIETNLNDRDTSWKGRRSLSIARNFRHHVPLDNKQAFRVDVETDKDATPERPTAADIDDAVAHPVEYGVILYRGYSSDVVSKPISLPEATEFVESMVSQHPDLAAQVASCLDGFVTELGPNIPDCTTLQAIRSRRHERDEPLEFDLLSTISAYDGSGVVDSAFPKDEYESVTVSLPEVFDGTDLPVRVLMKTVGAAYLSVKLNHCAKWLRTHPEDAYLSDEDAITAAAFESAPCRFDDSRVAESNDYDCVDEWVDDQLQSMVMQAGGKIPAESD
ncbi:DNA cytosine methyltransferase [Halorussus sp. MSC15.2]|uniref:DNA cytosine methyltransferase n=1 Tax=Halorussus sp. MSC15.2 TaxID=2283638 RepID=UPI0013CFFFA8|nr:DNA (cytosine-5-)-methyltransferase [Halorussus sp. MSC15.2]NEU59209.1 DNA (cytosine-5-)-methyltransferase [Halorussus sp. MSC15.2]